MYKVVVVEDEEIARKGIIFTINWDALNCMIAGEAANGEEGAEVIRRLRAEEAARRRRQWVRMGAAVAACVVLVLGTLFGRQHSKEITRDVAEPACYAADEERPLDEMEQEAVICMTAADRDWIADALACRLGDRAAEYMQEQEGDLWLQGVSAYAESLRALLRQRGYALPEGAEEVLLCIEEE